MTTSERHLTLLYTANIDGRLDVLPRMATLIRRERASADGLVVLLDGGSLCSVEVWPCAVTKMRAGRTMLEAMGYDAAVLGGTDLLPLAGLGEAGRGVLSEIAAHQTVPALNVSYSALAAPLFAYKVVQKGDLRVGVTAEWQPAVEVLGEIQSGSALAQPDPDGVSRAIAALTEQADITILMLLDRPSDLVEGVDIVLWPGEEQALTRPPALAVKQFVVERLHAVRLLSEKVLVCDDSVPVEPTISAVLEMVVEEATRLRAG